MKHSSKASGFTLIELMIVITIIAVLAAILAPISAIFREKSGAAAGVASTCCIRKALELHRAEEGYYPDNILDHNNLAALVRQNGCDLVNKEHFPLPTGYPILKSFECRAYAIDVVTGEWFDQSCENLDFDGFPGYEAIFELNGLPGKESFISSRETCRLIEPSL